MNKYRARQKAGPRLCKCFRQSQAEVISKSSNKSHQTWGPPFRLALYNCGWYGGACILEVKLTKLSRHLPILAVNIYRMYHLYQACIFAAGGWLVGCPLRNLCNAAAMAISSNEYSLAHPTDSICSYVLVSNVL